MPAKKNNVNQFEQRTLGPVQDLERHIPSDWWRTIFNSVYLKTDGDVVENEQNTIRDINTIINVTGLEINDKILDMCCGQGRHSLELARRGFSKVTGLDRSRYLIRLARQRARKENLNIVFKEGDARQFRMQASFYNSVLILGNSFGYFEREDDDLDILKSCMHILVPGGTLVLDIAEGEWIKDHYEPRSWEWIDKSHFVCRERSLSQDRQRLISREVVTHAERGIIADQFYAERLYDKSTIRALLEKSGFKSIRFHCELQTESERNQDLGMMARRILLTASTSRTVQTAYTRQIPFPNVTVVMGDPRLPDEVKLEGHFNPEDFETINRLKRALSEIEGYEFEYVDNHAALLGQFRSKPPEFVLNLCDEGFNNNAFLELHVPAFMDMLAIPYSGAGPTCLGICYNKSFVRSVAETLDIPVPLETYYTPADQSATIPATFPALVKPNFGDSSIGITKDAVVDNPEELIKYINALNQSLPGRSILVQEFLEGTEYSVGIIGNPGLTVRFLPILEVDYSNLPAHLPRILGYESKWDPDSPYWKCVKYIRANLSETAERTLIDQSMMLFERLGCRDYARFDFRADTNSQIKLMEVNPNPGWCWDGKLNFMAGFDKLRYSDLIRLIIEVAQERIIAGHIKSNDK